MKLNIGDVYNGGTVFAIQLGVSIGKEYPEWDKRFPDWKEKPVYFLHFNTLQSVISFDEYINQCPWIHMIKDEYKKDYYAYHHQKSNLLSIPEDSIERE